MEQFLEKVYAPLADTQVDALFWCLGTHEATWLSDNIPVVRRYRGQGVRHRQVDA